LPKKRKKKNRFELDGRLITRAELARRAADLVTVDGIESTHVDSLDLSLESARAGFLYQSPIDGVSLEVTVEFAGRVRVKDAYADYREKNVGLRAGFFKAPSTLLEMDGRMSLARAERGLLSDILTERLETGGRRPGILAEVFAEGGLAPSLALGVVQGSYLADEASRETEFIEDRVLGAQSLVARAGIAPDPLEAGVYATWRVGTDELPRPNEDPEHFFAAGADAKLDTEFEHTALRVWLDANAGKSWYSESAQAGYPWFIAGRLQAAFRFGGLHKGELYVEPYAAGGAFDPDLRVTADFALEAAVGANVGFWKRGRVTLEGGLQHTQRNFPADYALAYYNDRRSLIAQLAMDF
jgi:hypothetical protein